MLKYKFDLFNTTFILSIEKINNYEEILKKIKYLGMTLHKSFNIYDLNSEISTLNKDKSIIPSIYLKEILEVSIKYEHLTDYYFNTNQKFIEENNIFFKENKISINNEIDLGGIAKGYFMLMVKSYLNDKNIEYSLYFGGALLASKDQLISVRDIHDPNTNCLSFNLLADHCIHTSSFYWQKNDNTSHIHSKNHGYNTLIKSVSVIDKNPILADVFSTALYCMEKDIALEYIKKYNLNVIYILEKDIYINNTFKNIELLKDNFTLHYI